MSARFTLMPELPEVTIIATDLNKELTGRKIISAKYVGELGQQLRRKTEVDLSVSLPGKTFTGVERMSKQIVASLDSGEYLVWHLKITGRLLYRDPTNPTDEFSRLVLGLDNEHELRFTDRNGLADCYLTTQSRLDQIRASYGPEVFAEGLTPLEFLKIINSSPEPTIKQTLLNQKIISGAGNIYADEALFLARLHPTIKPKTLTTSEAEALLGSIKQVLTEGLADRGTTIDSYVDIYGRSGTHAEHLRVYGRSGQPCPVCQTPIEYMEVGGRRTFVCPNCQTLPQLSLF